MKSTAFTERHVRIGSLSEPDSEEHLVVPTLSAYAVEYSEFTPAPHLDYGMTVLYQDTDYRILGDRLYFRHAIPFVHGGLSSCRLVIHYHGIRDYALLFPQISDQGLRTRLGQFYEEAETAFEYRAWLSFALMAAAVYEGLLGWCLHNTDAGLHQLTVMAVEKGVLSEHEAATVDCARTNRNLVHASKSHKKWLTRSNAMDMRTVMDKLVRDLSIEPFPDNPETTEREQRACQAHTEVS